MAKDIRFPEGFTWGVATASYQIEGAVDEDGRSPSIWDTFSATPGKVRNGDSGAVACDHYHRYPQDVALLRNELGIRNYRFSIAWPRILPDGTGTVNPAGLNFYDRLVDTLLAADITPWATLYHWDLPQVLQDKGGWPARMIVDAYAEYVEVVSARLGDRVNRWMTFNEPWVFTFLGYAVGIHAPGHTDWREFLQGAHHFLLAHAAAVPIIRANSAGAQIGVVFNPTWVDPASNKPEDQAARDRKMAHQNSWFIDPIYKGTYPADMIARYEAAGLMPDIEPGDMERIQGKPDFMGVNYYTREVVAHNPDDESLLKLRNIPQPGEHTEMGWEVAPDTIGKVLRWLNDRYAPGSIYVTENGAAFDDTVSDDGQVHDPRRVAFYQHYIASVYDALQDDVPVDGYFAWSLMDNFEWAEGYSKRFGIVYVDYGTQQRIVKDSGHWYASLIRDGMYTLT
ncbi:MAG: GH1 family beta-glucosidase [Chloroflexota bacterium]